MRPAEAKTVSRISSCSAESARDLEYHDGPMWGLCRTGMAWLRDAVTGARDWVGWCTAAELLDEEGSLIEEMESEEDSDFNSYSKVSKEVYSNSVAVWCPGVVKAINEAEGIVTVAFYYPGMDQSKEQPAVKELPLGHLKQLQDLRLRGTATGAPHNEGPPVTEADLQPGGEIEVLVSKEEKQLWMLRWLPKYARNRLVMKLAHDFAKEDKPLPLGLVAGQAIPRVFVVFFGRALFGIVYVALVVNLSVCPHSGYPEYPLAAWLAVIPFQFVVSCLEVMVFKVIVVPKIQVLGIPKVAFFGCEWPFALWISFRLMLSTVSALDFISDAAYTGLQMKLKECAEYGWTESVWRQLWNQSLLGKFGLDGFVPCWTTCSIIAWAVNFVPMMFAFVQALPKSDQRREIDYAIVHDAIPNKPTEGVLVDFNENGQLDAHESAGWTTEYQTELQQITKQNHGAALTCLAAVNGMELVTFSDFEYASMKADGIYESAIKSERKPINEDSQRIVNHIMSQVRRVSQKTVLCGALTNGLQLNVQIIAVAMFQYDKPIETKDYQALFSIMMSASMLIMHMYSAAKVLWVGYLWLGKLQELERLESETPGAGTATATGETPYKELKKGLIWLLIGATCCFSLVIYAFAKIWALRACPYSLWNITGCFVPNNGA